MKKSIRTFVASLILAAGAACAVAQIGTAITYQGQLKSNGVAVNVASDFRFTLFNAPSGGSQVGDQFPASAVPVAAGLFTVNNVDFGVSPWTADQSLWLQIDVRSPAGSGSFVPLGARQRITGAPYSLETRGINVAADGKVGIGTDSPKALFHLNRSGDFGGAGSLWVGGDDSFGLPPDAGAGIRIFNDSVTGASSIYAFDYAADGPRNLCINQPGGHVGVGTPSPRAALHLGKVDGAGGSGSLWISGDDTFGLPPQAGAGIRIFNDSFTGKSTIYAFDYLNDEPRDLVINEPGGRIGFGTPSPQAYMHLNGVGEHGAGSLWIGGSDFFALAPEAGAGIRLFNDSVIGASFINAYDYANDTPRALVINQTGGGVGIGDTLPPAGFTLDVAGNIRCVSVTQTSSSEFKQDIVPLNGALDAVMNLTGVSYEWNAKAPADVQGKRDIGFIAEDVAKVLPCIVAKGADGKALGIDYGRVAPIAVEAIKTLKAENDKLKAEGEQLKARLTALEAVVTRLGQSK